MESPRWDFFEVFAGKQAVTREMLLAGSFGRV